MWNWHVWLLNLMSTCSRSKRTWNFNVALVLLWRVIFMRHIHLYSNKNKGHKRSKTKYDEVFFFKWILRKSIVATSCLQTFVYFWWLSEWEHVHHNTQIQYSIRQLNWRIVLSWTLNHYEYPLMPSEKCNHSPESNVEWFADDCQKVFCFSNRHLFSWRSNAFFREVCIFARQTLAIETRSTVSMSSSLCLRCQQGREIKIIRSAWIIESISGWILKKTCFNKTQLRML